MHTGSDKYLDCLSSLPFFCFGNCYAVEIGLLRFGCGFEASLVIFREVITQLPIDTHLVLKSLALCMNCSYLPLVGICTSKITFVYIIIIFSPKVNLYQGTWVLWCKTGNMPRLVDGFRSLVKVELCVCCTLPVWVQWCLLKFFDN